MSRSVKAKALAQDNIQATPSSTHVIAHEGDIILVAGPDRVHLRVSSHCLRASSKVFEAMFGPHWYEGQGLSSVTPKEVPLVEDDAEALLAVCRVIHHQNEPSKQAYGPLDLLKIAVVIDKYQLNVAMRYAVSSWLSRARDDLALLPKDDNLWSQGDDRVWFQSDDKPMLERFRVLAAAYVLQAGEEFKQIASDLLFSHGGSYFSIDSEDLAVDILPWKVFRYVLV